MNTAAASASFLIAALLAGAPARAASLGPAPLGEKPYGVLLLGEGGSQAWNDTIDGLRKALGQKVPFDFSAGPADSANMQAGIDALQEQGARKIVVVPLLLSSYSEDMDQIRYLLGMRDRPSASLMNAPHAHNDGPDRRLSVKVPIVLAKALDDHPLLVATLADRARALVPRPDQATLVLIGAAPAPKDAARDWASVMSDLAQKTARQAGFRAGSAMALHPEAEQRARDRSRDAVVGALRKLRVLGPVAVVPLELSSGAETLELDSMLDGTMVSYDGKDILPDLRIVHWAKLSAEAAAKLPDMRLFKDAGQGLPPPPPLTFEHKLTAPGGRP